MAIICINYKDGNDLEYRSVDLSHSDLTERKVFDSGDFVKDWYNCIKFVSLNLCEKEHVSFSSSVDHFIMDGAPYDSAYLVPEENGETFTLRYEKEFSSKGIEFFVKEGTQPTWIELKQMCEQNENI